MPDPRADAAGECVLPARRGRRPSRRQRCRHATARRPATPRCTGRGHPACGLVLGVPVPGRRLGVTGPRIGGPIVPRSLTAAEDPERAAPAPDRLRRSSAASRSAARVTSPRSPSPRSSPRAYRRPAWTGRPGAAVVLGAALRRDAPARRAHGPARASGRACCGLRRSGSPGALGRHRRHRRSVRCRCCSWARSLIGFGNSSNQLSRYAAADMFPEARRASAIGTVVWARHRRRRHRPEPHRASGQVAARLGLPRAGRSVPRAGRLRRCRRPAVFRLPATRPARPRRRGARPGCPPRPRPAARSPTSSGGRRCPSRSSRSSPGSS